MSKQANTVPKASERVNELTPPDLFLSNHLILQVLVAGLQAVVAEHSACRPLRVTLLGALHDIEHEVDELMN